MKRDAIKSYTRYLELYPHAEDKEKILADLGVTKTHSRPHVSDDNPYSESQFRTMKYRPEFPDRFGCVQDSRAFCQRFFHWYRVENHCAYAGLGCCGIGASIR
jgi:Integrase core domain